MKRLVFVLAACVAAMRATPAAAQAGPDQTAKFVKTIENTNKSLREAREQLQKTVDTYNSIVDMTAKDTKDAYKDLGNKTADCEKKVANVAPKVDEMNAEASTYFGGWKDSAASITDASLKAKSQARLTESQGGFNKIAAAGKDARQHFETLMTDLKNQTTFLGHDLNPGAIKSLKPDAAKFNTRASTTLGKIDAVIKANDDYVASMKP
jgi:uncharacterized phage infection (PIP) family protein YhgE